MNAEQLKKNVGQLMRLRPHPVLVELQPLVLTTGQRVLQRREEKVDYKWRIEEVREGVKLHCTSTGHVITLGADNVREFRTPDFLLLRCQLTLGGNAVHIEPIWERGGHAGAKNVARAYIVLRSDPVELRHAINVRSVKVAHYVSHRPCVHVTWDRPFADAFYDVDIGSVEYILGGRSLQASCRTRKRLKGWYSSLWTQSACMCCRQASILKRAASESYDSRAGRR